MTSSLYLYFKSLISRPGRCEAFMKVNSIMEGEGKGAKYFSEFIGTFFLVLTVGPSVSA